MSDTPNGILPATFERHFTDLVKHASKVLARMGISPDSITAVSFALGITAGILLALDHLYWAFLAGFLMGICDIIDGQIAGIINKSGRFGSVLDSVVDRYTDFLLFGGLGVRYYLLHEPYWMLVTALGLIGSFEVSYVKARGEGVGLSCNIGLVQRSERLILLGIGILFSGIVLKVILVVLAVLSHITALQRLSLLRKLSRTESSNAIKKSDDKNTIRIESQNLGKVKSA
jgi:phosphatidylglycerophosphate synthase